MKVYVKYSLVFIIVFINYVYSFIIILQLKFVLQGRLHIVKIKLGHYWVSRVHFQKHNKSEEDTPNDNLIPKK